MYSDHDIFLRELVSNAVDATQKLKTLSSLGEVKGDLGDLRIDVVIDADKKKTLAISDKGVGMTAEEVDKYLNQVAFSGAEEFLSKYKGQDEANIIGHFGLGFYSAFMLVSDQVIVRTKRATRRTPGAVLMDLRRQPRRYSLETATDKEERGTDVILHLNEESQEFLEPDRIRRILERFCRFLPVPHMVRG